MAIFSEPNADNARSLGLPTTSSSRGTAVCLWGSSKFCKFGDASLEIATPSPKAGDAAANKHECPRPCMSACVPFRLHAIGSVTCDVQSAPFRACTGGAKLMIIDAVASAICYIMPFAALGACRSATTRLIQQV